MVLTRVQKMVLEVLSSPGQGVYGVGMHELVLRTGLDYTKVREVVETLVERELVGRAGTKFTAIMNRKDRRISKKKNPSLLPALHLPSRNSKKHTKGKKQQQQKKGKGKVSA